MRKCIRDFVKIVSENLDLPEPIYEFGALQPLDQKEFADLRPFFPGKQYIGCDYQAGPGVDKVLDLHDLRVPSESIGTALCLETLEHVEFPRKAVDEMYRILSPTGVSVISSVMNFPIHEHPSDYWRFTPEGLKSLLKPFPVSFSYAAGDEHFPHTVVSVAFKASSNLPAKFKEHMDQWEKRWKLENGNTIRERLKLLLPPVLSDLGRKIKKTACR